MAVKTLSELFEHELKDIYYAEHRLVEALTQLAEETKHREIKRAYTTHKKETQGQIKRLKQVFKLIGEAPEPEKCPGIEGLLKEKQNFVKKEKPSQEILDYYNLGAASKTERYEITAYEGLIEIAQLLGIDRAAELLGENLQEEQATLDKLKALSEGYDTDALVKDEEEAEETPAAKKGGASKGSKEAAGAKGAKESKSTGASKDAGASKGSKSAAASKGSGAAKGTAASGRDGGSKSASGKGAAKGLTKGLGPRNPAGPTNNDAGEVATGVGYRGEVEADDIMVAPDPVVTAGQR